MVLLASIRLEKEFMLLNLKTYLELQKRLFLRIIQRGIQLDTNVTRIADQFKVVRSNPYPLDPFA
ncbi:MAG: hypothetical protein CL935_02495 [Deltaproteobacteria bacterium]|nr:hypothetical protein [Deltaproteobacteria bacterium]